MNPVEIEKIRQVMREGSRKVSFSVEPETGDPRAETLEAFARDLVAGGLFQAHQSVRQSRINIKPLPGPFMAFFPEGDLPRHVYQALPTGKEWEPFLDLIKTLASGAVSLSSDSLEALKGLKEPHLIRVLINPSCPFCARTVSLVNRLATASPLVTAWIIDVELFPEWVRRVSLKSVPTTILEEEIIFPGSVKEEDLIGWLGKMGSPDYLRELYRNDLLEKRMARTVERLKKRPQDLPKMADLLKAEEFGIKLGAMAVIEQLVDEAPRLHGVIFETLSPLLQETADLLVGDVIYLLGLLHDPRKAPALEKFLVHSNPEVAEAAREALASG
jgi:hypothetical protein